MAVRAPRNWPSSEECSEAITEECCVEMKKGLAISKTVLLTAIDGTPEMDTVIPITDIQ